jgi:cobalt-zinc-cadmium efflux system outer membrane protein
MMRRMPVRLPLFAIAALATPAASVVSAFAQEPRDRAPSTPLTLEQALAEALAANRTIAAARLRRDVDRAGIGVAGERPNPELRFEAERETPKQSLTAGQLMELGGKRARRIAVAEAVLRTGEAELARVVAETRGEVRRAYYGLASAQARLLIADEMRGLAARAAEAARARFEAGDIPRLEVLQAELASFQAENDRAAAAGERAAVRSELNALIGRDPQAPTVVAEDVTTVPLPDPQQAAEAALARNAELAILDRQIAEATARAALARAQQLPDPTVEGGVTRDSLPEFLYGWRAAVAVTVPVFTRHRAAVQVEEATLRQLRMQREALAQQLRGTVDAALARATTQEQQYLRFRDQILPRSREIEAMAEDAYRSGQTNLIGLLQALQAAREVRSRAVQAAFDYQVALAELERAAALGEAPPPP